MNNYTYNLAIYQCITPLHIGCGQDVGLVDLPVIRERTTNYPFIPGSGIRGAIRDCHDNNNRKYVDTLFGPESDAGAADHAGCVSIHDAQLLFFPVRSNQKVFVYITCPFVLERFYKNLNSLGLKAPSVGFLKKIQINEDDYFALGTLKGSLFLEEFSYQESAQMKNNDVIQLPGKKEFSAWLKDFGEKNNIENFSEHVVIVNDRSFDYYVRNATIIIQHNRLTSAKTVEERALFSVESLPPETIFYGVVGAVKPRKKESNEGNGIKTNKEAIAELWKGIANSDKLPSSVHVILGGHESTGMGITKVNIMNGEV
jgi:CRISPR-associated protein Cmr4